MQISKWVTTSDNPTISTPFKSITGGNSSGNQHRWQSIPLFLSPCRRRCSMRRASVSFSARRLDRQWKEQRQRESLQDQHPRRYSLSACRCRSKRGAGKVASCVLFPVAGCLFSHRIFTANFVVHCKDCYI